MAVHIPVSYSFKQKQFKSPNWCKLVNSDNEEKATVGSISKLYVKLLLEASQNNPISITYYYKDIKETIVAQDSNPYIILDLNDKLDLKPINIKIVIGSSDYSYAGEFDISLQCKYLQVDSNSFAAAIDGGNKIFELSEDIIITDDITIPNDLIIMGNEKRVNMLNEKSLIIDEGVTVKIYDTSFKDANPCFIQKDKSSLELYDCNFEDCYADDFEGLGSVIHCDIDLSNLAENDDFKTKIERANFINCSGAILHDGELIVNDCNFLIDNAENVVSTAPSFLYQSGGEASIRNSKFDISLDTDYFCENQVNVKLGQALLVCGENAIINGRGHIDLQSDDNLYFTGNPYNNVSHIFMKYYYPQIETCVYVSPITNRESKAVCYAVSGVDWIFKENVQITRASWGTENHNGMEG